MKPEAQNLLDSTFASTLIHWYEQNKRELPWRKSKDPYVIWLSEIILQQTRVQQGLPYFEKFINTYPDVRSFALATEQGILKLWQGLGYYSRARNMLVCAKQVVESYEGRFPDKYEDLLKLKGVGKYTAAAIASFSYGHVVPVVDGNVLRVLSRIFGIDHDIGDSTNHEVFREKAESIISKDDPSTFNQAIMEFGALHCTPKSPQCEECIFKVDCFAERNSLQSILPIKKKKIKKRTRYFNYFVPSIEGKMLVKQRAGSDIWKGLYEFILVETTEEKDADALLINEVKFLAHHGNLVSCSDIYKHILSHQTIFARFFTISVDSPKNFEAIKNHFDMEEIANDEFDKLPVSRLIDKYLKQSIEFLT